MKRIFLFFAMVVMSVFAMAQAPQKMNFQTLLRNSDNELVTNQTITMEISVMTGSNTVVYTETQTVTTNANGVATFVVGEGEATQGTFSGIEWSAGNYHLQTTADLDDGASAIVCTTPLLSVPYALYAEKVGNTYTKAEIDALLAELESKIGENGGSGEQDSTGNGEGNGMECVDLGLSVKWATCNIGASKPEGYGNYYAWGETATKDYYDWNTYKYGSDEDELTKYCRDRDYGIVDNKTTLEKGDDVAYTTLGGKWRMPTDAEWAELIKQCHWSWVTYSGVKGYMVEATNGNSIFLPAAGYRYGSSFHNAGFGGYYWSSSLFSGSYSSNYMCFNSSDGLSSIDDWTKGYLKRCLGFSVRPVLSIDSGE